MSDIKPNTIHPDTLTKFAKELGSPKFINNGECFDCNKQVTTFSIPNDMIIVHAGRACEPFNVRFTPTKESPFKTWGFDETGSVLPRKFKK